MKMSKLNLKETKKGFIMFKVTSTTKVLCHYFFDLKKIKCFALEISRLFFVFVKSTNFKICDVIIGIAA